MWCRSILPVIPDLFKHGYGFQESIPGCVFSKYQIEAAAVHYKQDGRHGIEDLDPFPAFTLLTPNIKHPTEIL